MTGIDLLPGQAPSKPERQFFWTKANLIEKPTGVVDNAGPSTVFITLSLAAIIVSVALPNLFASAPVLLTGLMVAAALTGLSHGALDLWISREHGYWDDLRGFIVFHVLYLAVAACVVAGFILLPTLTLVAFIAISIFHFADDWYPAVPKAMAAFGAALLIFVATSAHPEDVTFLFSLMTGRPAPEATWSADGNMLVVPLFWLAAGTLTAVYLYHRGAAFELATLTLLAALAPPLIAFTVYFVGLHAPRHFGRFGHYALSAGRRWIIALYTVVAIILLIAMESVLTNMIDTITLEESALRLLFVGLAALTFPHMILLSLVQQKEKMSQVHATS